MVSVGSIKMTIAYYSDNVLSKIVAESTGLEMRHIVNINYNDNGVIYGILRGGYQAALLLTAARKAFYYVDNGYFDARYVDDKGQKEMTGCFRVVKNGTHDIYVGKCEYSEIPNSILLLPPSHYSAFANATTVEDWVNKITKQYPHSQIKIRNKGANITLESDIKSVDAVCTFNSMSSMKAIELGKPVRDDYGCFRNKDFCYYDMAEVRQFYEPKQYLLSEFKGLKWM